MGACPRCAEPTPVGARFCPSCGSPVAPAAEPREERKRVSVLFCDLVGFTSRAEGMDIEDVRGLLSTYYARLRAELERHGGTVEKFIGDAVMALFGAPVAREDDPERAVRAALAICATIAQLNADDPGTDLHVRVGVTTGEALIVLDANPSAGEGMASGAVVNLAARLQTAAPMDGILVDEVTWRTTERHFTYESAGPVSAKGIAEPVRTWRPLAVRASFGVDVDQAPRHPLVGREHELAALRDTLATVRRDKTPHLLTVVGPPGMGKSRLVWELGELVEADPELVTWRQGRCLPYGEGTTMSALTEIVKAQAAVLDSDSAAVVIDKLGRTVADLIGDPQAATAVGDQLGVLIGVRDRALDDTQVEAFAGWRAFLEALAVQGPTVLVVEDLQWADDLLLDFLDHLLGWSSPVQLFVVATARPELFGRRQSWADATANRSVVDLAPLSEEATARLMADHLAHAELPAETQSVLLERAGGNPLYAEEYLRMLVDRGFLHRVEGRWDLRDADQLPLPESVEGIIAARLDALGHRDKQLVQDASVIGKVGWIGALAAVGRAGPAEVEHGLDALEHKQLLRHDQRSVVAGERQWAFRHVLVRDVAYAQLPKVARAQRHERAARWLEQLAPDRAADRSELLAHHWQAAWKFGRPSDDHRPDLVRSARLALRAAGDRAVSLNAFGGAARWYSAALELWPVDDTDRPRLLLRLGEALFLSEETGRDLLEEAYEGLLAQNDLIGAADAARQLMLWFWGTQGPEARTQFGRAAALIEHMAPSEEKVSVLCDLAHWLVTQDRGPEAVELGRRAFADATTLGLPAFRAEGLAAIGLGRIVDGDTDGVADLQSAFDLATAVEAPKRLLIAANLANAVIGLGDLRRAVPLHAEALQIARRTGMTPMVRHLEVEQSYRHYWQGAWDEARRFCDGFLHETEAGAPHMMETACRLVRAQTRRAGGDDRGALEDLARVMTLTEQDNGYETLLPSLAIGSRLMLESGRREEAERMVDRLIDLVADGSPPTNPDWTGPLAFVLDELGRPELAAQAFAAVRLRTPWLEAAQAILAGDFAIAAETYAEIGSRPDEAFARLLAGRGLLEAGRRVEAMEHLDAAWAFYRQVDATAYLGQIEQLLN